MTKPSDARPKTAPEAAAQRLGPDVPQRATEAPTDAAERITYRHGDLQRALLAAAVAMAREGGPDAIVLREATRRAGVAPNAAYRHFAGHAALFEGVREAALAALARAIEASASEAVRRARGPTAKARAALRGVGLGYLRFASDEPGLFRTAFAAQPFDVDGPGDRTPAMRGATGHDQFELLGRALDGLVAVGDLPAARRPGAEFLAWSTVHGMAMLMLDGPLRGLTEPERMALAERAVAMVVAGLCGVPGAGT